MLPDRVRREARVGSADDHGLAARAELIRDADDPFVLGDLSGDADDLRVGVVINLLDPFVANGDVEVVERERRDRQDREESRIALSLLVSGAVGAR
jgi:hypothetical protein